MRNQKKVVALGIAIVLAMLGLFGFNFASDARKRKLAEPVISCANNAERIMIDFPECRMLLDEADLPAFVAAINELQHYRPTERQDDLQLDSSGTFRVAAIGNIPEGWVNFRTI